MSYINYQLQKAIELDVPLSVAKLTRMEYLEQNIKELVVALSFFDELEVVEINKDILEKIKDTLIFFINTLSGEFKKWDNLILDKNTKILITDQEVEQYKVKNYLKFYKNIPDIMQEMLEVLEKYKQKETEKNETEKALLEEVGLKINKRIMKNIFDYKKDNLDKIFDIPIDRIMPSKPIRNHNKNEVIYFSPLRDDGKNPSFSVNVEKNRWYDFALGEGGGIIDLYMKIYNVDFKTAISELKNF